MQLSYVEAATKLRQAWEVIDVPAVCAPRTPRADPRLLAEMLQFLWPGVALSACVLLEGGEGLAAALDEAGEPRPEWAALIRVEPGPGAGRLPTPGPSKRPCCRRFGLTGLACWRREDRAFGDKVYGALLLAVPEDDGSNVEAVRALLAACTQHLALRLEMEGLERRCATGAAEQAWHLGMAEVGEVSIPVMHEFNNFPFNALLLHTAVLKFRNRPNRCTRDWRNFGVKRWRRRG